MLLKGSKKLFPSANLENFIWNTEVGWGIPAYAEPSQSKQLTVGCLLNPILFAFQKQGEKVSCVSSKQYSLGSVSEPVLSCLSISL